MHATQIRNGPDDANARLPGHSAIRLGARLKVIAPTRPDRDALLRYLTSLDANLSGCWTPPEIARPLEVLRDAVHASVAVVAEDGALLQWLDAWKNVTLPVYFEAQDGTWLTHRRARGILAALGSSLDTFKGRAVGQLSLFDARLAGFVKSMLVEPELLVLDCLFEGLGYEEQRRAAAFIDLFRNRYPLRRVLYLGLFEPDPAMLAGFVPLIQLGKS